MFQKYSSFRHCRRRSQRGFSLLLVLSLLVQLFTPAIASAQFLDFFASQNEPPRAERQRLITMLVAEDLMGEQDLIEKITRYGNDMQLSTGAQVISIPVPRDASPAEIAEGNAALYFSGLDGDQRSQLIGTVLIGDVPLPTVEREGEIFKTIYPYVDLRDPVYRWDGEKELFVFNANGDHEPEIWHGVIQSRARAFPKALETSFEKQVEELEEYFDQNHQVRNTQKSDPFDAKIFYANLPTQKEGLEQEIRERYARWIDEIEHLVYMRWNKTWVQDLLNDEVLSLEIPWDEFDSATRPSANAQADAAEQTRFVPDVQSKFILDRFLNNYLEGYRPYLSSIHGDIEKAGRWTPQDIDTTISIVAKKDLLSAQLLKSFNDGLEKQLVTFLEQNQVAADVWVEREVPAGLNTDDGYWNGVRHADLDVESCTRYRGTPASPGHPYGQMTEFNILYDIESLGTCGGVYDGCCFDNITVNQLTGEYVKTSSFDCRLPGAWNFTGTIYEGASTPVISAKGSEKVNKPDEIGAQSCASIFTDRRGPNLTHNFSSLMVHDEPRPETIRAQVEGMATKDMPIDDPRGVTFYDYDDVFQRVNFFDVFALRDIGVGLPDDQRRILLLDALIAQLDVSVTNLDAIMQSSYLASQAQLAIDQFLTWPDPPTFDAACVHTLTQTQISVYTLELEWEQDCSAAMPPGPIDTWIEYYNTNPNGVDSSIYTNVINNIDAEKIVEAIIWLDKDITTKNEEAFQIAFDEDNAADFFLQDSFRGYEYMEIIGETADNGTTVFEFERQEPDEQDIYIEAEREARIAEVQQKNPEILSLNNAIQEENFGTQRTRDACRDGNFLVSLGCFIRDALSRDEVNHIQVDEAGNVSTVTAYSDESIATIGAIDIESSEKTVAKNSAHPVTITVKLRDENGDILLSDYKSQVELMLSDADTFIIQPARVQRVVRGEVKFFLTPQRGAQASDINILAQVGQIRSDEIRIRMTEDMIVGNIDNARLSVDDTEGTLINIQVMNQQREVIETYDDLVLTLDSRWGTFQGGERVIIQDGRATVRFLPGTRAGDGSIQIRDTLGLLSELSIPLTIEPGEASGITFVDPAPEIINGAPPVDFAVGLEDQYGNLLEEKPESVRWEGSRYFLIDADEDEASVASNLTDRSPDIVARPATLQVSDNNQNTAEHALRIVVEPTLNLSASTTSVTAGEGSLIQVDLEAVTQAGERLVGDYRASVVSEYDYLSFPSSIELENGEGSFIFDPGNKAGTFSVEIVVPGYERVPLSWEVLPSDPWRLDLELSHDIYDVGEAVLPTATVRILDEYGNISPEWSQSIQIVEDRDRDDQDGDPEQDRVFLDTETEEILIEGELEIDLELIDDSYRGLVYLRAHHNDLIDDTAEIEIINALSADDWGTMAPRALLVNMLGIEGIDLDDPEKTSPALELLMAGKVQAVGALIADPRQENFIQGSPNQSAEEVHESPAVSWEEDWKPGPLLAGGLTSGDSTKYGASDAYILLGDPTMSVPKPDTQEAAQKDLDPIQDFPDMGRRLWTSPDGEIKKILTMDINGDGEFEILNLTSHDLYALYQDYEGNMNMRDMGPILRFPDGVKTIDKISLQNYEGLVSLSEGNHLTLHLNDNGRFVDKSLDIDFPIEDVVDLRAARINDDDLTDLLLIDKDNALWALYATRDTYTSDPQFIASFGPEFVAMEEDYSFASTAGSSLPAFQSVEYPILTKALVSYSGIEGDLPATLMPGSVEYRQSATAPDRLEITPESVDQILEADFTVPFFSITQSPIDAKFEIYHPTANNNYLELTTDTNLVGVLRLESTQASLRNAEILLPALEHLIPDTSTLVCETDTGEACDMTIREVEEAGTALWIRNLSLETNKPIRLRWEYGVPSLPPLYLLLRDDNGDNIDDIRIPWEENGEQVIRSYDSNLAIEQEGGHFYEEHFTTLPNSVLTEDHVFQNQTERELTDSIAAQLTNDEDGDLIPDNYDFFPTASATSLDLTTTSINAGLDDTLGAFGDDIDTQRDTASCSASSKRGECAGTVNSMIFPNIAFLAPGTKDLYVPPYTIPGPPGVGFPLFWLPPPPITSQGSLFRMYLIPTLSGDVALSMCGSAWTATASPVYFPNCFVIPIKVPQSCTPLPSGGHACDRVQLGNEFGAGEWNQSTFEFEVDDTYQVKGVDIIMTWLNRQAGEMNAFSPPSIKVMLPEFNSNQIDAPASSSRGFTKWKEKIENSALGPYLSIEKRVVTIPYPEFPTGGTSQLNTDWEQWKSEFRIWKDRSLINIDAFERNALEDLDHLRQEASEFNIDLSIDWQSVADSIRVQADKYRDNLQVVEDWKDSFQTNIDTINNYGDQFTELFELPRKVREFFGVGLPAGQSPLEKNLSAVGDYFTQWVDGNKNALKEWQDFQLEISGTLEAINAIPAAIQEAMKGCVSCVVDRGTSMETLVRILLGAIDLPILKLPRIPDIVMDFSRVNLGLNLVYPEIEFQPVEISLPRLPAMPPVVIPDGIGIPTLEQMLGVDLDVSGGINDEFNSDINLGAATTTVLNRLTQVIGLPDQVFEMSGLPNISVLPTLPNLSFGLDGALSLPSLNLPALPTLPGPPDALNLQVIDTIATLAEIPRPLFRLFCLLLMGVTPVPEWNVNSYVVHLTNRTEHIPDLDFSAGARMPTQSFTPPNDTVVNIETSLMPGLEALQNKVNDTQESMECLVGSLSQDAKGRSSSDGNNCLFTAEDESVLWDDFENKKAYTHASDPTLTTQTIAQEIDMEQNLIEGLTHMMEQKTERFFTRVKESVPESWVAQASEHTISTNLVPQSTTETPSTTVTPIEVPGLAACDDQGDITPIVQTNKPVEENFAELLYAINDELYSKHILDEEEFFGDVIEMTWEDFTALYRPLYDLRVRNEASSARIRFDRENLDLPYYEWRATDRIDHIWEEDLHGELRATDYWDRTGLVLRDQASKYEIRPLTTRVTEVIGDPTFYSYANETLENFTQSQCEDPSARKPFFPTETVLIGKGRTSRIEIRVPPREDQSEEFREIVIRQGEETMVDYAEVCVTRGEVEVISGTDIVEIDLRDNIYMPHNARIELSDGDRVTLELFDGSEIHLTAGERYHLRRFTAEEDRLTALQEFETGNYYGSFSAQSADGESYSIQHILHDVQLLRDDTPPYIRIAGNMVRRQTVGERLIIDAQRTTDDSPITDVWWDFNPDHDRDGDGNASNDRDFPFMSSSRYTPYQLLRVSLPPRDDIGSYSVTLNVQDEAGNTSYKEVAIHVEAGEMSQVRFSPQNTR